MAWLRCPRCSCTFRATTSATQVCPACGWRGWQPDPVDAPERSQYYRAPPEGAQGRQRTFMAFLLLTIATLLVYPFVYYWKVFAELDRQHGRHSPAAWYFAWVVLWIVLLVGAAIEVLVWYYDNPLARIEVHIALFSTAGAAFLACGAMHIGLGLVRLRDYRRARGLSKPLGGVGFALITLVGAIVIGFLVATGIVNSQVRAVWQAIESGEPAMGPGAARAAEA